MKIWTRIKEIEFKNDNDNEIETPSSNAYDVFMNKEKVVKVPKTGKTLSLNDEINLSNFLQKVDIKNVSVPKMELRTVEEIAYLRYEKLKGESPEIKKKEVVIEIAEKLGKFHKKLTDLANDSNLENLSNYKIKNAEESFLNGISSRYESCDCMPDSFKQCVKETLEKWTSPKKKTFIHNDFHRRNLLAEGNQLTGILDWTLAGWGDFHLDLRYFIGHSGVLETEELKTEFRNHYIENSSNQIDDAILSRVSILRVANEFIYAKTENARSLLSKLP